METIIERMAARHGHYMKKDMVQSQFDTLEIPGADEPDVIEISIEQPLDAVIADTLKALEEVTERQQAADGEALKCSC